MIINRRRRERIFTRIYPLFERVYTNKTVAKAKANEAVKSIDAAKYDEQQEVLYLHSMLVLKQDDKDAKNFVKIVYKCTFKYRIDTFVIKKMVLNTKKAEEMQEIVENAITERGYSTKQQVFYVYALLILGYNYAEATDYVNELSK